MPASHKWYGPGGATPITGSSVVATIADTMLPSSLQVLQTSYQQVIHIGDVSASTNVWVWLADHRFTVRSAYLLTATTTTGSGAGNRWDFQIHNETDSVNLLSTAKTTNGAEITADVAYALGPNQNLTLEALDAVELQITKTGAPTSPLTQCALVLMISPAGDT